MPETKSQTKSLGDFRWIQPYHFLIPYFSFIELGENSFLIRLNHLLQQLKKADTVARGNNLSLYRQNFNNFYIGFYFTLFSFVLFSEFGLMCSRSLLIVLYIHFRT